MSFVERLSEGPLSETPLYTVEPLNNGHVGDEHLSIVQRLPFSSEVEMYGQYIGRGRAVCPL